MLLLRNPIGLTSAPSPISIFSGNDDEMELDTEEPAEKSSDEVATLPAKSSFCFVGVLTNKLRHETGNLVNAVYINNRRRVEDIRFVVPTIEYSSRKYIKISADRDMITSAKGILLVTNMKMQVKVGSFLLAGRLPRSASIFGSRLGLHCK